VDRAEAGGKVRHPERLVYYEMHNRKHKPDQKFLENPLKYLPAWFAAAIGEPPDPAEDDLEDEPDEALEFACGLAGEDPLQQGAGWQGQAEAPVGEVGEGATTRACAQLAANPPPALPSPAAALWQRVRQNLRQEMPQASFERYVRPLQAVDQGSALGVLRVRAPDAFTAQWCRERLHRTVERLLAGMNTAELRIDFYWEGKEVEA
jgi:hypothetical protein